MALVRHTGMVDSAVWNFLSPFIILFPHGGNCLLLRLLFSFRLLVLLQLCRSHSPLVGSAMIVTETISRTTTQEEERGRWWSGHSIEDVSATWEGGKFTQRDAFEICRSKTHHLEKGKRGYLAAISSKAIELEIHLLIEQYEQEHNMTLNQVMTAGMDGDPSIGNWTWKYGPPVPLSPSPLGGGGAMGDGEGNHLSLLNTIPFWSGDSSGTCLHGSYCNWRHSAPRLASEDVLVISRTNQNWDDIGCCSKVFVCQYWSDEETLPLTPSLTKPSATAPTHSITEEVWWKGHSLEVLPDHITGKAKTQELGYQLCRSKGGYLAAITSQKLQHDIDTFLLGNASSLEGIPISAGYGWAMLGGIDFEGDGNWTWRFGPRHVRNQQFWIGGKASDGGLCRQHWCNWATNEPRLGAEHGMALREGYSSTWKDLSGSSRTFLCQYLKNDIGNTESEELLPTATRTPRSSETQRKLTSKLDQSASKSFSTSAPKDSSVSRRETSSTKTISAQQPLGFHFSVEVLSASDPSHERSFTQHDAYLKCREKGGYLAAITSQRIQDAVVAALEQRFHSSSLASSYGHAMTSGTDEDEEGTWIWKYGPPDEEVDHLHSHSFDEESNLSSADLNSHFISTPFWTGGRGGACLQSYCNWPGHEPNNVGGQHIVALRQSRDHQWDDIGGASNTFICQYRSSSNNHSHAPSSNDGGSSRISSGSRDCSSGGRTREGSDSGVHSAASIDINSQASSSLLRGHEISSKSSSKDFNDTTSSSRGTQPLGARISGAEQRSAGAAAITAVIVAAGTLTLILLSLGIILGFYQFRKRREGKAQKRRAAQLNHIIGTTTDSSSSSQRTTSRSSSHHEPVPEETGDFLFMTPVFVKRRSLPPEGSKIKTQEGSYGEFSNIFETPPVPPFAATIPPQKDEDSSCLPIEMEEIDIASPTHKQQEGVDTTRRTCSSSLRPSCQVCHHFPAAKTYQLKPCGHPEACASCFSQQIGSLCPRCGTPITGVEMVHNSLTMTTADSRAQSTSSYAPRNNFVGSRDE